MTHAWCQNVPRDEAVRAAEDGRECPLPTLEEAIAGVTERRPPEPGGRGNVTSFAEPAKCSPTVSETGEGKSGLRTERVTLEITRPKFANYPTSAFEFMWGHLLRDVVKGDRESVRVVEEVHFDDLAQVAMERDAAIRERDTLRAERITQALTADRFASAVAEADRLRARAEALESAPAASGAAGTEVGE